MMERIQMFAPSLVVLVVIAVLNTLLRRLLSWKFEPKMESISWTYNHIHKLAFWELISIRLVGTPVTEELFVRIPLVLIFDKLSILAWVAIIVTGAIFAYLHMRRAEIILDNSFKTLMDRYQAGLLSSDDYRTEITKIKKTQLEPSRKQLLNTQILQVGMAFTMSVVAGYLGIKYQSVWLPVIVHSFSNTAGIPLVLFFALILRIFDPLLPVWWRIQSEWRKLTGKKYRN